MMMLHLTKNTTGNDAFAVLIIIARTGGTEERHVKIYSGPTENSTSGATLLFEVGRDANSGILNAQGEQLTTPVLKIQNNHFLTVENVDDSRAGINDIRFSGINWVVERG